MSRRADKYYFRGKEARGRGAERAILDGRLSSEARRAFLDGWDEEDRLRRPKPTAAQSTESATVIRKLKNFAAEMRLAK